MDRVHLGNTIDYVSVDPTAPAFFSFAGAHRPHAILIGRLSLTFSRAFSINSASSLSVCICFPPPLSFCYPANLYNSIGNNNKTPPELFEILNEGMKGGSGDNPSMTSASNRRRRPHLRRLKSVHDGGAMLEFEPAKRTRGSDSNSDQDSSNSSSPTSCSSPEEAVRVRTCGHGAISVIGRRREMEDAVAVVPDFSGEVSDGGYGFYAVYDGHGGSYVAHTCRDRMHLVLAEEVAKQKLGGCESLSWKDAFTESFRRVDAEVALSSGILQVVDGTVGSTAVVAVVEPSRIVVANCGDSRAVLSRGGKAVALSCDHKPERPDELERVEAAGGKVINWNGYRVLGVLATSRSIGDHYLKPYVTHEPEVIVMDRTARDEFLILASDGLWDVLSNEIACKLVRNCLRGRIPRQLPCLVTGTTAADAAALLAEVAVSQGSKDNISVVVVELKKFRCSSDQSMPEA